MFFKVSTITASALFAVLILAGPVKAIAKNAVDACNGTNNYGPGHSCAFYTSDGSVSDG
ncbi:hypothetical protein FIBSPDRAFT_847941, partial [Athelia psychrophila]